MKIVLSETESTFENIRNKIESSPVGTKISFPYVERAVKKLISYFSKEYQYEYVEVTIQSVIGSEGKPEATYIIKGRITSM